MTSDDRAMPSATAALAGSALSHAALSRPSAPAAIAAHTPGPWEAEYGTDGYYYLTHSDGLELSEVDGAANARLIAAAPALYEALVIARDFLRSAPLESGFCCCGDRVEAHNMGSGHSPVDDLAYYAGQIEEQITAALAKATGQGQ